jgi:hypothetical protein
MINLGGSFNCLAIPIQLLVRRVSGPIPAPVYYNLSPARKENWVFWRCHERQFWTNHSWSMPLPLSVKCEVPRPLSKFCCVRGTYVAPPQDPTRPGFHSKLERLVGI